MNSSMIKEKNQVSKSLVVNLIIEVYLYISIYRGGIYENFFRVSTS